MAFASNRLAPRPTKRPPAAPAAFPKPSIPKFKPPAVTAPSAPKPTLGPASPPAPSAPAAAPKPQKPEFDQPYYNSIDAADHRERDRLNELQGQESAVKFDFGLDDPTNPNNRANAMKRAFLARASGRSGALASEGQLYSGAHERAMSRTRREEEQASADLRSAYEAALNAIGAEKAKAKNATEEDKIHAFESWLARAPQADVAVSDTPAAGAAAAPTMVGGKATPVRKAPPIKAPLPPDAAKARAAERARRQEALAVAKAKAKKRGRK